LDDVGVVVFVDLHDACLVADAVAVVGRTEDGDDLAVMAVEEAVHHQLVSACDEGESVFAVKFLADVLAEDVAGSTRTDAPPHLVFRVTPEQVAHGSVVGHLHLAVEATDDVECVDAGAESTVHAEYFAVDEGSERQVVE